MEQRYSNACAYLKKDVVRCYIGHSTRDPERFEHENAFSWCYERMGTQNEPPILEDATFDDVRRIVLERGAQLARECESRFLSRVPLAMTMDNIISVLLDMSYV